MLRELQKPGCPHEPFSYLAKERRVLKNRNFFLPKIFGSQILAPLFKITLIFSSKQKFKTPQAAEKDNGTLRSRKGGHQSKS